MVIMTTLNVPIDIPSLFGLGIATYILMYVFFEILRIWVEVAIAAMIEK